MITIVEGHRVQTPEAGSILTNGESFSYEVALGDGMPEWNEVPDTGQLEPVEPEVIK